jgi:hypothetical protein
VVVVGSRFAFDAPAGRAGWRLAGLVAHAQSRATAKMPATGSRDRASSKTRATSTGSAAGSAGSQTRWPGQRQERGERAAGERSPAIGTSQPQPPVAGRSRAGTGRAGGGAGAQRGQHADQHPGEVGEQRDVDRDGAGRGEGAAGGAGGAGRGRDVRGVRPTGIGRLPGGRAADGGRSAVAVPVSPGKCPGKGVRGAPRYIRTRIAMAG